MRYYKNGLAKGSHITIKLPKDGQTTKKKDACKMLLVRKCGLHPLIYTRLEFDLAQDVDYGQRFPGLGSEPPQTGHTFSVGLIIRLALHLEHLTLWSLTRLISSGSRVLLMWFFLSPVDVFGSIEIFRDRIVTVAVPAKELFFAW